MRVLCESKKCFKSTFKHKTLPCVYDKLCIPLAQEMILKIQSQESFAAVSYL